MSSEVPRTATLRPPSGLTVLMADDDPDDRMLTQEAVDECGAQIDLRFVADGDELLDYLRRRGAFQGAGDSLAPSPTLILLDLNMPRKNGREALREIKNDPALRSIPVVVLTTSRDDEDIAHAYEAGANSYIVKPVTFEGLVGVVEGLRQYWLDIVATPTPGNGGDAGGSGTGSFPQESEGSSPSNSDDSTSSLKSRDDSAQPSVAAMVPGEPAIEKQRKQNNSAGWSLMWTQPTLGTA